MIDHIGGINTLLYVLSNGGTLVVSSSRAPDAVCAAIARHKVELLPTSPTFLNLLLLSEAYRRYDLTSLRLITYGTEMMPRHTLDRVAKALPHATLQQTYGLSEVGILRSKSEASRSLWVKVGGEDYDLKVQDGTLWVKARSAMLGYLNADSPFDEEGWLNTGDLVETRGEFIRFLGRKSDVINVGGQKVYPAEVEEVLLSIPNVCDVSVTGEANPITGNIVVARFNLIEPEESVNFKKRVREFCRGRMEPFKVPVRIEIVNYEQFSGRFKKIRQSRPASACSL
jgi:acyl-coenzyme A synthetase/AMP-(fatty) acid ligase